MAWRSSPKCGPPCYELEPPTPSPWLPNASMIFHKSLLSWPLPSISLSQLLVNDFPLPNHELSPEVEETVLICRKRLGAAFARWELTVKLRKQFDHHQLDHANSKMSSRTCLSAKAKMHIVLFRHDSKMFISFIYFVSLAVPAQRVELIRRLIVVYDISLTACNACSARYLCAVF